jgi:hypothetical protein
LPARRRKTKRQWLAPNGDGTATVAATLTPNGDGCGYG